MILLYFIPFLIMPISTFGIMVPDVTTRSLQKQVEQLTDQLEKFNKLYLTTLDRKITTVTTTLSALDANFKTLQEKAHVWDIFRHHIDAWNDAMKAVDHKIDLIKRTQDDNQSIESKLTSLEFTLNHVLNKVDQVNDRTQEKIPSFEQKLNDLSRIVSNWEQMSSVDKKDVSTRLNNILRRVINIESGNCRSTRSPRVASLATPVGMNVATILKDMEMRLDKLADHLAPEDVKQLVSVGRQNTETLEEILDLTRGVDDKTVKVLEVQNDHSAKLESYCKDTSNELTTFTESADLLLKKIEKIVLAMKGKDLVKNKGSKGSKDSDDSDDSNDSDDSKDSDSKDDDNDSSSSSSSSSESDESGDTEEKEKNVKKNVKDKIGKNDNDDDDSNSSSSSSSSSEEGSKTGKDSSKNKSKSSSSSSSSDDDDGNGDNDNSSSSSSSSSSEEDSKVTASKKDDDDDSSSSSSSSEEDSKVIAGSKNGNDNDDDDSDSSNSSSSSSSEEDSKVIAGSKKDNVDNSDDSSSSSSSSSSSEEDSTKVIANSKNDDDDDNDDSDSSSSSSSSSSEEDAKVIAGSKKNNADDSGDSSSSSSSSSSSEEDSKVIAGSKTDNHNDDNDDSNSSSSSSSSSEEDSKLNGNSKNNKDDDDSDSSSSSSSSGSEEDAKAASSKNDDDDSSSSSSSSSSEENSKAENNGKSKKTTKLSQKQGKRVKKFIQPSKTGCHDLKAPSKDGVYQFEESDLNDAARDFNERYCDFKTSGAGWTVIQRRGPYDEQENFNRSWVDYKSGFGNLSKDFWFGLEFMHRLTDTTPYVLRIELEDFDGQEVWAEYSYFQISPETDNYALTIGEYKGNASDSMAYHAFARFSTYDRNNDNTDHPCCPCAPGYGSGWWFDNCSEANLNGIYREKPEGHDYIGVIWEKWHGDYSLKATRMLIRPLDSNSDDTATPQVPEDP